MENYPSYSYPDSGDSSPRSREIDFENPPPSWEEPPPSSTTTLPPNHKVKFMVSYGGKIQPRSHDNLLAYNGGETKILAVDRAVKFSTIHAKLASLVSSDSDAPPSTAFTFKYQLPGEDLDALISVTNDDDLEHMMHEYDRMWRGSAKPARLRLFLFPDQPRSCGGGGGGGGSAFSSTNSDKLGVGGVGGGVGVGGGLDRGPELNRDDNNKFVENLISGGHLTHPHPHQHQHQHQHQQQINLHREAITPDPNLVASPPPPPLQPVPVHNNVDFLFGLDKVPVQVPVQAPVHVVKSHDAVSEPEMIHELNRLQISAQELHHHQMMQQQQQQQQQQHSAAAAMYQQKNDENFGDPYQKPPPTANLPASVQIPAGYWQAVEHHQNHQQPPPQQLQQQQQHQPPPQQLQQHQQFHPQQQQQQQHQQQQPVYMMHAPPQGNVYHTPMMRPVGGQIQQNQQGFYQVQQRMPADPVYREQPVYSMPAPMPAVSAAAQVRPAMAGESTGYAQVAYDSATGRQVYYAAAPPQGGVVTAPYPGMTAAGVAVSGGEMRGSGDGKVVQKVVPSSAAV